MAFSGRGVLARQATIALVAVLAIVLVVAGRALLGVGADASPSESVVASASTQGPSPTQAIPSTTGTVPAELHDKAWLGFDGTQYQVGTVGAGPTSVLPSSEIGMRADGNLVISVDAATHSVVVVRNVATGEEVLKLATDLVVDEAAVFADRFYVSGRIGDHDGGVWQGSLAKPALAELIRASGEPVDGGLPSRGPIALSPTGQTLASTLCLLSGCITQIVDTTTGALTTVPDFNSRWVSDLYVLTNDRPNIRVYGIDDGKLRWELDGTDFWDAYFATDGRVLYVHAQTPTDAGPVNEIWRVDSETGQRKVLFSLPANAYLNARLSDDQYAVLLAAQSVDQTLNSPAEMQVLDLGTGVVVASRPFPGNGQ